MRKYFSTYIKAYNLQYLTHEDSQLNFIIHLLTHSLNNFFFFFLSSQRLFPFFIFIKRLLRYKCTTLTVIIYLTCSVWYVKLFESFLFTLASNDIWQQVAACSYFNCNLKEVKYSQRRRQFMTMNFKNPFLLLH